MPRSLSTGRSARAFVRSLASSTLSPPTPSGIEAYLDLGCLDSSPRKCIVERGGTGLVKRASCLLPLGSPADVVAVSLLSVFRFPSSLSPSLGLCVPASRPTSIPIPLNTQATLSSPVSSPPNKSFFSTSPIASFAASGMLQNKPSPSALPSLGTARQPRTLKPLGSQEVKVLLLENISAGAVQAFQAQGYQVEHYTKAWTEEELLAKIGEYHAIGIRSKTKMTEKVIKAATKVGSQVSCSYGLWEAGVRKPSLPRPSSQSPSTCPPLPPT